MSLRAEQIRKRWQRIEEAMQLAGIKNQAELARKLGVTSQTISGWKRTERGWNPDREHYIALAIWSGLTPSWIEHETEPKFLPQNDFQDRILAGLRLLPPEAQARLADQVEFEVSRVRPPKSEQ